MGTLCGAAEIFAEAVAEAVAEADAAAEPAAPVANGIIADCRNSKTGIAAGLTAKKFFLTLFHPCCRLDRHSGKNHRWELYGLPRPKFRQ